MKSYKYTFLISLILLFFLPFSNSIAKLLPYIRKAIVDTKVSFDSKTGIFTYSYKITNSPESIGEITSFDIDISRPPAAELLEPIDYMNNPKIVTIEVHNSVMSQVGFEIVPVAFLSSPYEEIHGGISPLKIAGFIFSRRAIYPGKTLGDFIIASKGLVGIRNFIVEPMFDCNEYFPSIDGKTKEERERIFEALGEAERTIIFEGKTLGPTALPFGATLPDIVYFIIKQKHEAFSLKWIDNEGVANSLNKKLENAKMKIEQSQQAPTPEAAQNNLNAAKNILNALINELDAQKGKHIDDNAYYLLKVNVEYLLHKMK